MYCVSIVRSTIISLEVTLIHINACMQIKSRVQSEAGMCVFRHTAQLDPASSKDLTDSGRSQWLQLLVSCEKRGAELLQTGTVLVRDWALVNA